jgi:predicted HicB family RNase H-like nuclease
MLKSGRPSSSKTQKEKALDSVKEIENIEVKMQRFNVDIPETLHRRMKVQAAKEGVKLNSLTISIFNEYLSKYSEE